THARAILRCATAANLLAIARAHYSLAAQASRFLFARKCGRPYRGICRKRRLADTNTRAAEERRLPNPREFRCIRRSREIDSAANARNLEKITRRSNASP